MKGSHIGTIEYNDAINDIQKNNKSEIENTIFRPADCVLVMYSVT